jgi:hypothetical protein
MQSEPQMTREQRIKEGVCICWFAVVALAFFAPALQISLPMGALTALYSILLMGSAIALVLPIARQKGKNNRVE